MYIWHCDEERERSLHSKQRDYLVECFNFCINIVPTSQTTHQHRTQPPKSTDNLHFNLSDFSQKKSDTNQCRIYWECQKVISFFSFCLLFNIFLLAFLSCPEFPSFWSLIDFAVFSFGGSNERYVQLWFQQIDWIIFSNKENYFCHFSKISDGWKLHVCSLRFLLIFKVSKFSLAVLFYPGSLGPIQQVVQRSRKPHQGPEEPLIELID